MNFPARRISQVSPFLGTGCLAGKHTAPFAPLKLPTLELHCPHVLVAGASITISTRLCSGLFMSHLTSCSRTCRCCKPTGLLIALILCKEGTKSWYVKIAHAELPGSEKPTFSLSSPARDSNGTVLNMVGLPDFILTRPTCVVPPSCRSMVGISKSTFPIETPPEVLMTSTRPMAARIVYSIVPDWPTTILESMTSNAEVKIAAMSIDRLVSRTSLCLGSPAIWRGLISLPVLRTPTTGLL